jgi:demethylmenaquinone methyltransferase/2-methoxy-6-polyprenyl-1,4-benzoquinol methylase
MTTSPHPVLTEYYGHDAERGHFVAGLFDRSAGYYDQVCQLLSLGSGQWYRRWALGRAGLRPGMRFLDVATGTGLVARAAARILGGPGAVVGVDPSAGMLGQARRRLAAAFAQGRVEALPFAEGRFDFVCIGYALRHAADLEVACRECHRVLTPGGRLLILEISRARWRPIRWLLRGYFTRVLPLAVTGPGRGAGARLLMRYYWDTIEACVPPETILAVLARSGFAGVERRVLGGCLSEYVAVKPPAIAQAA